MDEQHFLLSLGANLGDPPAQLARAVELLRARTEIDGVSSIYRTDPVGEGASGEFYNLVVAGRWSGSPHALLSLAMEVEEAMGRVRTLPNAPRPIDVDVLAVGAQVTSTPSLILPHPRMHERGFVLHPLAEVAPEWRHPVLGRTARELLNGAPGGQRVELWGTIDQG